MNNRRKVEKREAGLRMLGLMLLVLVGGVLLPCLLLGLVSLPKLGTGLCLAAALPVVALDHDRGGASGSGAETFEARVLKGVESIQERLRRHEDVMNDHALKIAEARRMSAGSGAAPGFVSEGCARFIEGVFLAAGLQQRLINASWAADRAEQILGRTALTSSDIPLPAEYGREVVELVSLYGSARKWGTVYPLGAGTVYLPRLKTSPVMGLIAGSATVTERVPQTENVTFSAEKFGGLVRLPSEIEEDSSFAIGQFLSRYFAREIAKVEDHNFFVGTGAGSGANGSVKGLCLSTIDNSKVSVSGTAASYAESTIAHWRALRAVVDSPAMAVGAYYCHPSFDQHLCTFNTSGNTPYQAAGARGATLDGFPVRWVDVMPAYSTSDAASTVFALFGDLTYQYLGIRGGIRFDTSREAGFTTDEILVRGLERFTIGLMATGAVAGLETYSS